MKSTRMFYEYLWRLSEVPQMSHLENGMFVILINWDHPSAQDVTSERAYASRHMYDQEYLFFCDELLMRFLLIINVDNIML